MWAVVVWAAIVAVLLVRWRRSGLTLGHFFGLLMVKVYTRIWHGLVLRRQAPFPDAGAVLLVANHTCSADPIFLQAGSWRPMGFVIAREYYDNLPWARWVFEYLGCVPVCRDGQDVGAVRLALSRMREGRVLVIFPEGGLSAAGQRRLRPGKGRVALIALRSRVPVVPAFISRGPQHNNVPRAWLLPSRAGITFGRAVDLASYRGRPIQRRLLEEVTELLMRRIAELEPERRKERRCAIPY